MPVVNINLTYTCNNYYDRVGLKSGPDRVLIQHEKIAATYVRVELLLLTL